MVSANIILQGGDMKKSLEIEGLPFLLNYKPIRHLHLRVCPPDAQLRISAPFGMEEKNIIDFILSKMEWVKRQRAVMLNRSRVADLREMTAYFVWGKRYGLKIHQNAGQSGVMLENGSLHLFTLGESGAECDRLLLAWHKQQLAGPARERIAYWQAKYNLPAIEFGMRKMKSRWGSCAPYRNRIVLNTELVNKLPICLNYVVAHELTHFFAPNHGKLFQSMMDKAIPDWREVRKILNNGE